MQYTAANLVFFYHYRDGFFLIDNGVAFPAVSQCVLRDGYAVYYSTDPAPTVSAILGYLDTQDDRLIDLRVERPSLEERFLEITQTGGVQ